MRISLPSNLVGESYPNPTTSILKRSKRRRSKQPFSLEEISIDTRDVQSYYGVMLIFVESCHEAWGSLQKDLLCAWPSSWFYKLNQLVPSINALNPADQDSLNSAAGGNLLERRTQDVLTIIENKSKPKLTHAVNPESSAVTTAMDPLFLKQFQATPPLASIKAVEEICVTCGGAYPYYQCLAADGNTFPEFQDNI
ncbi:hypothetical protein Tco_1243254 [Tanacetum coccineum]